MVLPSGIKHNLGICCGRLLGRVPGTVDDSRDRPASVAFLHLWRTHWPEGTDGNKVVYAWQVSLSNRLPDPSAPICTSRSILDVSAMPSRLGCSQPVEGVNLERKTARFRRPRSCQSPRGAIAKTGRPVLVRLAEGGKGKAIHLLAHERLFRGRCRSSSFESQKASKAVSSLTIGQGMPFAVHNLTGAGSFAAQDSIH